MPDAATVQEADQQDPLVEAAARNVPLELHSISNDRAVPAARARMIDVDESFIYLEKPQIIGRNVRLHKSQLFEAFFNYNNVLFTFKTEVADPSSAVRLNQTKLVEGLVIHRPPKVKPGQRRQFFRTSLVTIQNPISGLLQEATIEVDEQPEPNDAGVWQEIKIVDASAGGFGVRMGDGNYSRFKIYHNYFVRVLLPDGKELTTMCELRQVRSILDGEATKLGFLLLPWPTQAKLNWHLQPLLQYLTELQRTRLAS